MLRRLHADQPDSFAFTPDNLAWAEAQITKYPEGRAQSAIIPLLWRAQEQTGWLTRPAIEKVAEMLGIVLFRAAIFAQIAAILKLFSFDFSISQLKNSLMPISKARYRVYDDIG